MNDFTKEELIEIKRGIDALFEQRDFKNKPYTLQFGWKIQSIIDNYCEHDYQKTLDKSGMYFILMCHKCRDIKSYVNIFQDKLE